MKEYRKFSRDVIWIAIGEWLPKMKGFLLLPLITKILGVTSYGIYSQIMVTIGLVSPFAILGLNTALKRFLSAEKNKHILAGNFWAMLSIIFLNGVVLLAILYFISPYLIKSVFRTENVLPLLRTASILIPLMTINQILLEYFVALDQSPKYTSLKIMNDVFFIGLIIYFLLQGKGILAIILIQIFITMVINIVALAIIIKQIGLLKPQFGSLKRYFSLGLPLFFGGYGYWAIHSADRYIIGYFLNIKDVGIYSGIYNLSMIIIALSIPIYFVLVPKVSKLWEKGEISEVKKYFKYSVKYFLIIGIPSVVGMSVLGRDILITLTTSEFSSAWILIPIIMGSMLIFQALTVVEYVFFLVEKTRIVTIAVSMAAMGNIILNIIMVPVWGILGAAIATMITYIGYAIGYFWFSMRYLRFPIDLISVIKSLSAALIMGLIIFIVSPHGITGLLYRIFLGAIIYTIFILLFRGFNINEIRLIRSIIQK